MLYFIPQTNNPQIWDPELTKALIPVGFEKGNAFSYFASATIIYITSLQNATMSDVGNQLFGV